MSKKQFHRRTSGILVFGIVLGISVLLILHLGVFSLIEPNISTSPPRLINSNSSEYTSSIALRDIKFAEFEIQSLDEIGLFASDFSKEVALYNYLSKRSEDELEHLFEQTKKLEFRSRQLQEFSQNVILQKLTESTPQRALSLLKGFDRERQAIHLTAIYDAWSITDLNSLIQHLRGVDKWRKQLGVRSISFSRMDLTEADLQKIARRLDEAVLFDILVSEAKSNYEVTDPLEAWRIIVKDDVIDILQTEQKIDLFYSLVEQTGFEQAFNSLDLDVSRVDHFHITDTTLSRLSIEDPEKLFQESILPAKHGTLDLSFGKRNAALFEWAKYDPTAAYEALSVVELDDMDAKYAQQSVLDGWAMANPHGLLDIVDSLPEDVQSYAKLRSAESIALAEPAFAVEIVKNLRGKMNELERRRRLELLARIWISRDINEALNFVIADEQTVHMRRSLMEGVVRQLTFNDPQYALELAQEYFHLEKTVNSSQSLEAVVIETIAQTKLDTATEMLSKIKPISQLEAFQAVGRAYIDNDQGEIALGLGNPLPDMDQAEYFENIVQYWATTQPEQLYSNIKIVSSTEKRSKAALWLLKLNEWKGNLTGQQINRLKRFLNDEDMNELKASIP